MINCGFLLHSDRNTHTVKCCSDVSPACFCSRNSPETPQRSSDWSVINRFSGWKKRHITHQTFHSFPVQAKVLFHLHLMMRLSFLSSVYPLETINVWSKRHASVLARMGGGGDVGEGVVHQSVCPCEGGEAPVWLTGSAKLLYSSQSSSGYNSHTKQLCSLLTHDRFPSPLWELCERTRWSRKMRFEPSPLSLSISLQAVRGERKHFGCFQSGSVYCKSFRGTVDARGSRYNQFMCCRVWSRPPQTRQFNLKLGFPKPRPWCPQWTHRQLAARPSNRSLLLFIDFQCSHHVSMMIWSECLTLVQNAKLSKWMIPR